MDSDLVQLSISQSADFLNVSYSYAKKLLDDGKLEFIQQGTARLIAYDVLVQYKKEQKEVSDRAMEELTKQAQELDWGY